MTVTPTNLLLTQIPTAKAQMLIRKPVREVFEAFIDPAITSKFWFTKGSGRLEAGTTVHWEWEMYNISVPVDVKEIEAVSLERQLPALRSTGAHEQRH